MEGWATLGWPPPSDSWGLRAWHVVLILYLVRKFYLSKSSPWSGSQGAKSAKTSPNWILTRDLARAWIPGISYVAFTRKYLISMGVWYFQCLIIKISYINISFPYQHQRQGCFPVRLHFLFPEWYVTTMTKKLGTIKTVTMMICFHLFTCCCLFSFPLECSPPASSHHPVNHLKFKNTLKKN